MSLTAEDAGKDRQVLDMGTEQIYSVGDGGMKFKS